jgi:hypothetical protein
VSALLEERVRRARLHGRYGTMWDRSGGRARTSRPRSHFPNPRRSRTVAGFFFPWSHGEVISPLAFSGASARSALSWRARRGPASPGRWPGRRRGAGRAFRSSGAGNAARPAPPSRPHARAARRTQSHALQAVIGNTQSLAATTARPSAEHEEMPWHCKRASGRLRPRNWHHTWHQEVPSLPLTSGPAAFAVRALWKPQALGAAGKDTSGPPSTA